MTIDVPCRSSEIEDAIGASQTRLAYEMVMELIIWVI